MTKRWILVAVLLLAGVVATLLLCPGGSRREPMFEGRTLSSWLDHHVPSTAAIPPYNSPGWKKADEALRTIGTNAIPTLLEMIRAKDPPPFLLKLIRRAERYRWTGIKHRSAVWRNEEAEYAFSVLNTNAVSAVPDLIKIYEEDRSPSSQRCAAMALGHIGRGAQAALPVLIKRFTHTNSDVRFYAVSAVMDIGGEPTVVVPALTSALKDSNVNVRWNALTGLSMFGSRGRPAVPEILKMLNDPGMVGTSSITQQVATTLWRIAPEKVGHPLVVEVSTPIVAGGVTMEAVKVAYHGKHQILVPAGTSVPAVRQYWNSDPRPRLTIYRGAGTNDANDRLLGHFEVLDVPSSPNVNISTLCVIADNQIILCARDNTREQFLEIRRLKNPGTRPAAP
jgi:hypothetical protein